MGDDGDGGDLVSCIKLLAIMGDIGFMELILHYRWGD